MLILPFQLHVDVIGLFYVVGIERINDKDGNKTKFNVIELDIDG